MNKVSSIIITILCMILVGCSNSESAADLFEPIESGLSDVDSGVAEVGIITDESKKMEIVNQVAEGSLDVENDTFEFENLTSYIGRPEAELISVIGAEGHPDGFATKLFGEDVTVSTIVEADEVTQISLLFPETDPKLLKNAIGEQIGSDPSEAEDMASWEYLGKTITQSSTDNGLLVTIIAE